VIGERKDTQALQTTKSITEYFYSAFETHINKELFLIERAAKIRAARIPNNSFSPFTKNLSPIIKRKAILLLIMNYLQIA